MAGQSLTPLDYSASSAVGQAGAARHKITVKKMKKMLKKAGLKTSGKRAALTRRVRKAHLRGGAEDEVEVAPVAPEGDMGGRRRRSRKNGLVRGVYRGVTGVAKGTLRSVGSVGRSVFGRGGRKGGEDAMA